MEPSEQMNLFKEFFNNYKKKLYKQVAKGENFIIINFSDILSFNQELAQNIIETPEESIRLAELAIEQLDLTDLTSKPIKNFRVRLTNIPKTQEILIQDIRSKHIGKLLFIEGIVKQKTDVRPQIVSARFECPKCSAIIPVLQTETTFKEPGVCHSCGHKGKFKLLGKELVDAQAMVIEEVPEKLEGGEQPKRINVLLKEDLVSPLSDKRTNPGSRIGITGYIKEIPIIGRGGKRSTRYDYVLEANNIEISQEDFFMIEFSEEEIKEIKELSKKENVYEILIDAIAPSIFGHEKIKEALVLQLFGGVEKQRNDGVRTRGDIHVLLVGDPGAGKSQMLKRISKVAPKSRYVSGRGASGAGLTASVVRDEFLGGFSLEAGALVLANRGIVLIDEMDKMSKEDTSAMHEAMEQQCYHYDFEILFSDGTTKKIGEYVEELLEKNKSKIKKGKDCEILDVKSKKVFTTDFKKIKSITPKRVSRHNAFEHFYEVTFDNGRKTKVTPKHPFFVLKDKKIVEIPVEELKKDFFVPAVKSLNYEGKTIFLERIVESKGKKILQQKKLDKNLALLLGYILSEGYSYKNVKNRVYEVGVSNTDKKIVLKSKKLFEKIFGIKTNINIQENNRNKKLYTVRLNSKNAYLFFEKNFKEVLEKSKNKRIPNNVKASKKNIRREFLKSYFEGDGFVDSYRVGYITSSYGMACDLQDLLLSLNITSKIFEEKRKIEEKTKSYYKVVIQSYESIKEFYSVVKEDKRKEKIKKILEKSKNKNNSREELVPLELLEDFNNILKELNISDGYFVNNIKRKQNANVRTLKKYYKKIEEKIKNKKIKKDLKEKIEFYKNLLYGDLKFLKVKSIKKLKNKKEKYVYDVTIVPTKTFISHGVVLHNTISISKANIQATLPSKTTVLAAANPKFGRFDSYQNLFTQIDMPPALINRFDLIFIVRDIPDTESDKRMAKHILQLHKNPEVKSVIDDKLLRKYFAYAKQNIKPELTEEALEEIQNYYVKMRNQTDGDNKTIPLSARQLEALVRLAEASAKTRLDSKVLKKDAERAINLLHYCLTQVATDESGKIDIDKITTGITSSTRNKIYMLKKVIEELEGEIGNKIPKKDIEERAKVKGIDPSELDELLIKLIRSGDIYEPTPGTYSRLL